MHCKQNVFSYNISTLPLPFHLLFLNQVWSMAPHVCINISKLNLTDVIVSESLFLVSGKAELGKVMKNWTLNTLSSLQVEPPFWLVPCLWQVCQRWGTGRHTRDTEQVAEQTALNTSKTVLFFLDKDLLHLAARCLALSYLLYYH